MQKELKNMIVRNKVMNHRHAIDTIQCLMDDVLQLTQYCEDGDWTKLDFNQYDKDAWYDMYDTLDYLSSYLQTLSSLAEYRVKQKNKVAS